MSIYTTGTRVQLHPATDAWMRGDRWGEVVAVACKRGHVFYQTMGSRNAAAARLSRDGGASWRCQPCHSAIRCHPAAAHLLLRRIALVSDVAS